MVGLGDVAGRRRTGRGTTTGAGFCRPTGGNAARAEAARLCRPSRPGPLRERGTLILTSRPTDPRSSPARNLAEHLVREEG